MIQNDKLRRQLAAVFGRQQPVTEYFLHRLMESGTMHTVTKALCVYKCTKLRL